MGESVEDIRGHAQLRRLRMKKTAGRFNFNCSNSMVIKKPPALTCDFFHSVNHRVKR
jgi:hypothetical protein